MDKELKEVKAHFQEQYFNQETATRIKNGVHQRLRCNKHGFSKKVIYSCCAAVVALGILVGSGFVSPAMANVLSEVPFLNALYEPSQGGFVNITDELKKQGYKVSGVSVMFYNKTMTVGITGSEKYFNSVKDTVKAKVNQMLNDKGIDAYKVSVLYDDQKPIHHEMTVQEKQYEKESNDLENAIMTELKKDHYGIISAHARINSVEKFVPLEILNTENRVDEMKQVVMKIVKDKNLGDVKIKVYKNDPKAQAADHRWRPVINTITEGLIGKSAYKVTNVGFSFNPTLDLHIETAIISSDSDAKQLAAQIENEVRTFITSDEVQKVVKGDSYKISIYSKDNKKLN